MPTGEKSTGFTQAGAYLYRPSGIVGKLVKTTTTRTPDSGVNGHSGVL